MMNVFFSGDRKITISAINCAAKSKLDVGQGQHY